MISPKTSDLAASGNVRSFYIAIRSASIAAESDGIIQLNLSNVGRASMTTIAVLVALRQFAKTRHRKVHLCLSETIEACARLAGLVA